VQELLGHASISTTQVYTRLDFQHLAKVYEAAHTSGAQEIVGQHVAEAVLPAESRADGQP